ncbi:unnamed protein product [Closterium sp. NIES-54]
MPCHAMPCHVMRCLPQVPSLVPLLLCCLPAIDHSYPLITILSSLYSLCLPPFMLLPSPLVSLLPCFSFPHVHASFPHVHASFPHVHASFPHVHASFSHVHASFPHVHASFPHVHASFPTQLPLLLAVNPSRCIAFVSARVRLFPPSRVVYCIARLDPLRCPAPSPSALPTAATPSPFPLRSDPSPPPLSTAVRAAATAPQSGVKSPTTADGAAVPVPTDSGASRATAEESSQAGSHRVDGRKRPHKLQLQLQLQLHEGGEEVTEEGWEGAVGKEGGEGKAREESKEGEEEWEGEEEDGEEEGGEEGEELEAAVVRGMGEVCVRHLMFRYLHTVFVSAAAVGRRWHTMQAHLYAEFQPSFLLSFLRRSSFYSLDAAYRACQQRGLQHAMVLLQQRMGNHHAALSLCLHALGDVDKALQVVATSGDDSLCASITHQAASNPHIVTVPCHVPFVQVPPHGGVVQQSLLHCSNIASCAFSPPSSQCLHPCSDLPIPFPLSVSPLSPSLPLSLSPTLASLIPSLDSHAASCMRSWIAVFPPSVHCS